jgi:septation ring formation regulator EzrA
MESIKNSHEESAFISLKIKELIDQQEKISVNIQENKKLLDNLKNNIIQNSEVMQNNLKILNEKLNKK